MQNKQKDQKLIKNIIAGNERALKLYYDTYSSKLMLFVQTKVKSEEDAEEIVHDTLLSSIDAFRDFAFQASVYTFVCSIAKRKVADYYRKQKIKRVVFSQAPQVERLLSILTTPEDELDAKLIKQHIELALASLDPIYQKILKKKYIQNLSVQQIARDLSMTFKSVESMLFRARKAFVVAYSEDYVTHTVYNYE